MEFYPRPYLQQLAPLLRLYADENLSKDTKTAVEGPFEVLNIDGRVAGDDGLIVRYVSDLKEPGLDPKSRSPLDPESDLFPNGILSELWFQKYTEVIPVVFLVVYQLIDGGDEVDLADQLLDIKKKLAKHGSRLMVVAIASPHGGSDDDHRRIRELQSFTQLTTEAIHYVKAKEASNAVKGVIASIPQLSTSFYNTIATKIAHRDQKFYDMSPAVREAAGSLTPKYLATRNQLKQGFIHEFSLPPRWSVAIKHLEAAYNSLTELLAEAYAGKLFEGYPMETHNLENYFKLRTLLDVTGFHIFRAYMSVGSPVVAFKKFAVHIRICSEIAFSQYGDSRKAAEAACHYWHASQSQLVAEYLVKAGHTVPMLVDSHLIPYYCGYKYHLQGSRPMDIVTEPALLFLQAYESAAKVKREPTAKDYLLHNQSVSSIEKYKIKLLQHALKYVTLPSFVNLDPRGHFASYINWMLGDLMQSEDMGNEKTEQSAAYFKKALASLPNSMQGSFRRITSTNSAKSLANALYIAANSVGNVAKRFDLSQAENLGVSPVKLVEADVDLVNQSLAHDTYLYDNCLLQCRLRSLVDLDTVGNLFGGAEAKLVVKSLTVEYDGGEFTVKHEAADVNKNCPQLVDSSKANMELTKPVVIHSSFNASKIGEITVNAVVYDASLEVSKDGVTKTCKSSQRIEVTPKKRSFSIIYTPEGPRHVRTANNDFSKVVVKPLKPDISLETTSHLEDIIVGETVLMPLAITFTHPKAHRLEEKVTLETRITVSGGDERLRTRIFWEGQKDDQPLDLEPLVSQPGTSTLSRGLCVSVQTPPGHDTQEGPLVLVEIHAGVSGGQDSYLVASYTLPLRSSPFGNLSFKVVPQYDPDDATFMPSPFVVPEDAKALGLPIVVRLWKAHLEVNSRPDVEVKSVSFDLRQSNAEILLEKIGSSEHGFQQFSTRSKTGFSHRTVQVTTTATVVWQREGASESNEYTTQEWDVTLPMSDPRVLLKREVVDGVTHFHYVLENPTPRVFTFTTQFVADNAWDLNDKRNIIPLKQSPFPVLPFSRCIMDWYLRGEGSDPELRVFDVNYKVNLSTLVLT
ncbi:hypothetical protein DICA3_B03246 [Diutina catenulata]